MKQHGPRLTYKPLHDRILAKFHGQFAEQTPQLQGEVNRVIFGGDHVQSHYSVLVMRVNDDQIKLGAGQAAGLRKGAQFAVYPLGIDDFIQVDLRNALLEILELGAVDSLATVTHWLRQVEIDEGAPAVLLDPSRFTDFSQVSL